MEEGADVMTWVRIDDRASLHKKLRRAGAEAAWLWVCGLCHCNRDTTSGRIDEDDVPDLYRPFAATHARELAAKLIEVGLWERTEGGYLVHDYEEYQDEAMPDAVEHRRLLARTRKQRERERNRAAALGRVTSPPVTRDGHAVTRDSRRDGHAVTHASRTPGPARPGPTRPVHSAGGVTPVTCDTDPRVAAIAAELERYPAISRTIGNVPYFAEQLLGQNLAADQSWLLEAVRDGVAELPEDASDAAIRRTLRKFVKHARPPKGAERVAPDPPPIFKPDNTPPPDRKMTMRMAGEARQLIAKIGTGGAT